MNRKPNTRVLITGASSGIGRDLARVFARHGHHLILTARRQEKLKTLAEEITREFPVTVDILVADLEQPAAAGELVAEIERRGLFVETLVNNAGFNVYGRFAAIDREKVMAMARLNMLAVTELTHRLLPAMIASGNGRVLNIASTGGFTPGPNSAVYCATKAYVLNFSEALAQELKKTGVKVTAVCPGATRSEFAQRGGMEDLRLFRGPVLDSHFVAETAYRAQRRGRSKVVVGLSNKLMIGSLRFIPRSIGTRVAGWLLS